MVRIVIFLILLLMASAYALWKGGGPERVMATILLSMLVVDQLAHILIPVQFASVDTAHLAIDLIAAILTFTLAMTAHRFWPLVAAVLQTLPLLAHFSRLADVGMHPIAYLTMQVAASWLLPPLLAAATWRHQTRLRRSGSDQSWQPSSLQSHLPRVFR